MIANVNIRSAIDLGAATLLAAGVAESRREAASLLAFVLGREKVFLTAHPEYELTPSENTAFNAVVGRRARREPFQYITGRQEFFGLDFAVDGNVLIPRPETEILVAEAINQIAPVDAPRFCEIGVGSGCISISILYNVIQAMAVGLDISPAAISVAGANAVRHNVADRLVLDESDVFSALSGKFDLIVSNPPYIPDADIDLLQTEVAGYEPKSALAGGIDGLVIVRRIVADAPKYLKRGGSLLIEIGFDQETRVKEMFNPEIWTAVTFLHDLQGIARTVKARAAWPRGTKE